MLIYKATNNDTGMFYVGQTILTLKQRKFNHMKSVRGGSLTYFHNALRKYGVDGFDWKIVCEVDSRTCLDNYEVYYIRELNSLHPNGYNLTSGGGTCVFSEETKKKMSESHKGVPLSEEHRKNISDSHMGDKNQFYGKTHTKESKLKMSKNTKVKGKDNPFYGKTHTDETKAKISAKSKSRVVSDETRKRMSEATKLWWKNKKALK